METLNTSSRLQLNLKINDKSLLAYYIILINNYSGFEKNSVGFITGDKINEKLGTQTY